MLVVASTIPVSGEIELTLGIIGITLVLGGLLLGGFFGRRRHHQETVRTH